MCFYWKINRSLAVGFDITPLACEARPASDDGKNRSGI